MKFKGLKIIILFTNGWYLDSVDPLSMEPKSHSGESGDGTIM